MTDLQKAPVWKRIAAWLFDFIITVILTLGISFVASAVFGYDQYSATVSEAYEKYETQYGVRFDISAEEYASLSPEQKEDYDLAYQALLSDTEAISAYNMSVSLSLLITTASILFAVLIWEFAIPLLLGNGQTLGKKFFSLCLMKTNGVKINPLMLFARTMLGKFTLEIMIPVYVLLMLFWNKLSLVGLIILAALCITQICTLIFTRTNSAIHDLLAATAVVDAQSQKIFESDEALIEYKKQCHAQSASEKPYL